MTYDTPMQALQNTTASQDETQALQCQMYECDGADNQWYTPCNEAETESDWESASDGLLTEGSEMSMDLLDTDSDHVANQSTPSNDCLIGAKVAANEFRSSRPGQARRPLTKVALVLQWFILALEIPAPPVCQIAHVGH
eukprot:GHVT01059161.1.p1 GENE.GHVT01059161.1~~GHVT01059161.1.p1  ORF type:complete len:139 (+),score=20.33 GHVT01059161.1:484-900(+)